MALVATILVVVLLSFKNVIAYALLPLVLLFGLLLLVGHRREFPEPIVVLPNGLAFAKSASAPDVTWQQLSEVYAVTKPALSSRGFLTLSLIAANLPVPRKTLMTTSDYKSLEEAWLAANPNGKPADTRHWR